MFNSELLFNLISRYEGKRWFEKLNPKKLQKRVCLEGGLGAA